MEGRHKHLGSGLRGVILFPVSREVFRSWERQGVQVGSYGAYLATFPCTCERGREEYLRRRRGTG